MGLALAAELNGYPGPSHVLELAQQLGLDEAQRIRVRDLFDAMKRDAVAVGEQLVALESELDIQFATRAITLAGLERTTSAIGERQAALRAAHLRYHLLTTEVLTPDQLTRYAELRGYRAGHGSHEAKRN